MRSNLRFRIGSDAWTNGGFGQRGNSPGRIVVAERLQDGRQALLVESRRNAVFEGLQGRQG